MPIFPGSKVSTESSGGLYVDDIPTGDLIRSRSGFLPASAPNSRRVNGCFTIITLSSNRQLIATSDQLVLVVNRGWVEAKNVFSGDRVFTTGGAQAVIKLNYWRGVETVYDLPAAECFVEGVLVSRG